MRCVHVTDFPSIFLNDKNALPWVRINCKILFRIYYHARICKVFFSGFQLMPMESSLSKGKKKGQLLPFLFFSFYSILPMHQTWKKSKGSFYFFPWPWDFENLFFYESLISWQLIASFKVFFFPLISYIWRNSTKRTWNWTYNKNNKGGN